jgi:hypothetical protein
VLLKLAAVIAVFLTPVVAFGQTEPPFACIRTFGQREWATLVKGLDGETKKQFLESESFRDSQTDNLKQLFVLSCEAVKRGLHRDRINAAELRFIRLESIALEYDRMVSKTGAPFSRITDAQVAQFYKVPGNVSDFEEFLAAKLELLRRNGATDTDSVTAEQKEQAKGLFAKFRISERQSVSTGAALREPFRTDSQLKARLQQSQFLTRLLMEKMVEEFTATDAEVADYISTHAELSPAAKRQRATTILERAKTGEDFAKLANEFTEDPGNVGSGGEKHGGLYADVPVGRMIPAFEKAALSLDAGQVHSTLVETDYGFHIVKLEKKTNAPEGTTYDVRHILVSTGYRDPNDPDAREVPVGTWVRTQIENAKEAAVMAKLRRDHAVTVAKYVKPRVVPSKAPVRKRR